MNTRRFDVFGKVVTGRFTRRIALGRLAGGGIAAGALAVGADRRTIAQESAPAGWRTEHLEVAFTPANPVSITRAGSGPPQRGDWFYIDAPIYAVGDVNGTRIGTYECFGAWVADSDDTTAPALRLTTVHYRLDDGSIMGIINEFGTEDPHVGAAQGGTGSYIGALGTFQQLSEPDIPGTPDASGTPTPAVGVVRAVFDLVLPNLGA